MVDNIIMALTQINTGIISAVFVHQSWRQKQHQLAVKE
jgi:cytochrome c oxidase subunit IV